MMPGTKLGPYEILSLIGQGGMGEVYRARDTKLDRDVAIKVLPAIFAEDPERLARFEREAKVLASLNHPNIASIYGVEERALIMEFVEGESPQGPMPFEDAWKICAQIADGLEYAHERRVVHRDLKPANVKVTPEGRVKILDFGLAKAFTGDRDRPASSGVDSPTLTMGATQAGVILGTAAYMAPEQVRGKEADGRADIWAFGVVLYELLTGERPFKGADASETMARVLTEEPNLEGAPSYARRLLRECLKKDPGERLRWVGDAVRMLESPAQPATPALSRARFGWVPWAVAGALLLAFASVSWVHFRERAPEPQALQYTIPIPEKAALDAFALSPDGRYLVLTITEEKGRRLWVRALDSLQAQPLAGTEDASRPFWSPDSRYIGFFAQGKLKKIAVNGGPPTTLSDAPAPRGGTWNRDGVIVFTPDGANGLGLSRVPATGGVPVAVTKSDGSHRFPFFLPDGRRYLYTTQGGKESGIYFASLESAETRRLLPDQSEAQYLPPDLLGNSRGYVLFVRDGTLMAQPVNPESMDLAGDLFPVAEQLSPGSTGSEYRYTISQNGRLVYRTGAVGGERQLTWFDRSGKEIEKVGSPFFREGALALSPDGKRIVTERGNPSRRFADLWITDLEHHTETKLTLDPSFNGYPVWSPDGSKIAFGSARGTGPLQIYVRAANGIGQDEPLFPTKEGSGTVPYDWSHDGRFIIYEIGGVPLRRFALPVDGDRKPIPLFESNSFGCCSQLSPDDRWLAYASEESGMPQVYVQPFAPGVSRPITGKWQISQTAGYLPRWRADGKELFYVSNQMLMAVDIKATADGFNWGTPRLLFKMNYQYTGTGRAQYRYAPSRDGQRFLVATDVTSSTGEQPLTMVVNWLASVKK